MAKIHLSGAEKETILLTSEADDEWEVYTFNNKLIKRLDKFAVDQPDFCRLVSSDDELGSKTYMVDKNRLSIHVSAPYSEDRKRHMSEVARKAFHGDKDQTPD